MDCFRFEIDVPDLEKAFTELQTHRGIEIFGEPAKGHFLIHVPLAGMVVGNFFSTGNRITIKITERPMVVTCAAIEIALNHYAKQLHESE